MRLPNFSKRVFQVTASVSLALIVFLSGASTVLAVAETAEENQAIKEAREQVFATPGIEQVVTVEGYVDIEGITEEEVFNFVSNLENDHLWYPGTLSSVRISGDGGAGTKYQEVVALTGQPETITATVLKVKQNKLVWFTSDNVWPNLTKYTFSSLADKKGVRFSLSSEVGLPAGISQEGIEGYLNLVFQSLLGALGKQGTITVK